MTSTWLRHRLEWLALRACLSCMRQVELSTALAFARGLARLAIRVLRREREWSLRNLELVFGPGMDAQARYKLATLAFEHHFMSYLEGARATEVSLHLPDMAPVIAACREGRGVVCCTVHLGSWETVVATGAVAGLPMAAVYREADNPLAEREFRRVRDTYGAVEWIPRNRLVDAGRALRAGKALMLMTDVNTVTSGITADFLGIPAQCPTLPARFALRFDSPVVPGVAVRERPGQARLIMGNAIHPSAVAAHPDPPAALTRLINAAFESWVLEYAEQYNWLHPRWRSRADGRTWTPTEPIASQLCERVADFPLVPARLRGLLAAT